MKDEDESAVLCRSMFEKKDKKTFPGKAQTVRAKVFCMYVRLSFFLAVQQEEEEEGERREVCL